MNDPRSTAFHGQQLRDARYRPMLDGSDADACGRCHDGALARPTGVTFAAPGAPSCASCHTEKEGVLACGTCHGDGARAYPPRNLVLFPADARRAGAHRAHVETDAGAGLPCSTCHPVPGDPVMSALHGNGTVEIAFETGKAGPDPSYDPTTGTCAGTCHDRQGSRPRPAWSDAGPIGCGSCHGSPPALHYPGACASCHREANDEGTALALLATGAGGPLHLNGRVDLGDGTAGCAACHGKAGSPWPVTAAHQAHRAPISSAPVDCASCHPGRADLHTPDHLDGVVQIVFADRAVDRGAKPVFGGTASPTCAGVACHGAGLADTPLILPSWTDTSGAARACTACHGVPPTQHTASTDCGRSDCHTDEVIRDGAAFIITAGGKALHVNGLFDVSSH